MNTPLTGLSQSISLSPQLAQRLTLMPDTLITARVEQVDSQRVTLRINGQPLTARTDLPLQPGRSYTFQVQFQNGQWLLRLQPTPVLTTTSTTPHQTPTLPPQQAIAQLFSLLNQTETPQAASLAPLLGQLSKMLVREGQQLNGKTLQRHLKDSGVLLENRLAKGEKVAQDTKSILLRLLQQLPETRKAEIQSIQSLLRHIEQHQLNNLTQNWFGFPLLFAPDSPVQHAQVWLRAPDPDWRSSSHWQALLQLDLRHSGLLEVLIQLEAEPPRPQITFWTPNSQLETRIREAAHTLLAQFPEQRATIRFSQRPLVNQAQPNRHLRIQV